MYTKIKNTDGIGKINALYNPVRLPWLCLHGTFIDLIITFTIIFCIFFITDGGNNELGNLVGILALTGFTFLGVIFAGGLTLAVISYCIEKRSWWHNYHLEREPAIFGMGITGVIYHTLFYNHKALSILSYYKVEELIEEFNALLNIQQQSKIKYPIIDAITIERAKDFIHFAIEHDSSICQYISLFHNYQDDVEDYITSKLHAMRLNYNYRYGSNTIFNTIDDIIVSGVYTDHVHVYVKPKQSAYYVIISLYHDGTYKIKTASKEGV